MAKSTKSTKRNEAVEAAVEAVVPVAAWTADADTRHVRSVNAATTLKERWADEGERARLEELSRQRAESLEAVTAVVVKRLQTGKGSAYGVGELTSLALADSGVQSTPFTGLVGTAQRWTTRRVCKSLVKSGVAREVQEVRKGRKVRCYAWVPARLRA